MYAHGIGSDGWEALKQLDGYGAIIVDPYSHAFKCCSETRVSSLARNVKILYSVFQ